MNGDKDTAALRQSVGPTATVAVGELGVPRRPSITITTDEKGCRRPRNPSARPVTNGGGSPWGSG
jgi:hypothetical protein